MRRLWTLAALCAPTAALVISACTGDDDVVNAGPDAGPAPDAGPRADTGTTSQNQDSGPEPLRCGNDPGPTRLLATIGGASTSELAAVNLSTKAVDGRLSFASRYGVAWTRNREPFLLAQETDIVSKLDEREPWKVVSSWSVRGDDGVDGGLPNANPSAIAVPGCGKGYVLRFNRNKIAVIDTAESADGGAPQTWIDLAPLLHEGDHDGFVEMTSAISVPERNRVYVLLGNVDLTKVAGDGYTALCATSKPTIVAIDTTTDQIVQAETLTLEGYNPPLGSSFFYDAPRDRFLVLSAGCNLDDGDGGAGAISRRRVEEVSRATGAVKTLVSLDDQLFPSGMAFVDENRAALAFFGPAFFWDPKSSVLGAPIQGGLDFLANAGGGSVAGTRATWVDGGPGPLEVVSVPFGDAGPEVVTSNPFTDNSGFVGSAELWPNPKP
jgi:hypothetical protein